MNNNIALMYHGITTDYTMLPKQRDVGAELYDVTLENFDAQMQWLHTYGFNNVILTFDDGEMNNYHNALAVLKKYNASAYFFIIAQRVGQEGYMGWDEIRRMHQEGMSIGSHGLSHEILTNLRDTQIEEELRASKKHLEMNLNIPIEALSIPRGFCDDKVIKMAYDIGYKQVFISERPKHLTAECVQRIAVKGSWSLARFQAACNGETPMKEHIVDFGKRAVQGVFKERGYNYIRNTIIRLMQ